MEKRKKTAIIALILYAVLMVWLLFLDRIGAFSPMVYAHWFQRKLALVPFRTIRHYIRIIRYSSNPALVLDSIVNLVGNVVMFIPLGFLPPCIWRAWRGFFRCLLFSALCVIAVELTQLFTRTGCCDVDDLILNVIGASAGYFLYHILSKEAPHGNHC